MKNNFKAVMKSLVSHCSLTETDELMEAINQQARKQKSYSSSHRYDLERFGLEEESIRKDTPFYLKFLSDIK